MSSRSRYYDQCYAQCPPSRVTIQPPPFVLNIPGPSIYCPDQPLRVEQYNPCVRYPYRGGGRRGLTSGYGGRSLYAQNFLCDDQSEKEFYEAF